MKKYYQQNNNHKKRYPKIGDLVYFHASLKPGDLDNLVACRGYVVRCPMSKDRDDYKLVIESVNKVSPLGQELNSSYIVLIGKKLQRKIDQISFTKPDWWSDNWLEAHQQRVIETVHRARSQGR
jgi:hypothetical protein